jgi:hypothetical protein
MDDDKHRAHDKKVTFFEDTLISGASAAMARTCTTPLMNLKLGLSPQQYPVATFWNGNVKNDNSFLLRLFL